MWPGCGRCRRPRLDRLTSPGTHRALMVEATDHHPLGREPGSAIRHRSRIPAWPPALSAWPPGRRSSSASEAPGTGWPPAPPTPGSGAPTRQAPATPTFRDDAILVPLPPSRRSDQDIAAPTLAPTCTTCGLAQRSSACSPRLPGVTAGGTAGRQERRRCRLGLRTTRGPQATAWEPSTAAHDRRVGALSRHDHVRPRRHAAGTSARRAV
jgi:hypothetical protein